MIRLFKPVIGSQWIVGVIGELQLDVLQTRLNQEYSVTLNFEPSPHEVARWILSNDPAVLKRLIETHCAMIARDQDDAPVLLMRNDREFGRFRQDWREIEFSAVREQN